LNELRALASPPANVKLALEPVVALISMTPKKPEWAEIKQWLRKDNFIHQVMHFDKDTITSQVKKFIQTNYLNKKEEFVIEKIFKASRAAGPLALWVQSIIEYADIFEKIEPLRKEVQ
jgi:dynein heavy chain 1